MNNIYNNLLFIDNTKTMEEQIKKIWSRNIVFIFFCGLEYLIMSLLCTVERLIQIGQYIYKKITKKQIRSYKMFAHNNTNFIQDVRQVMNKPFYSVIIVWLFFSCMFLTKIIYYFIKVSWWIIIHIIKPILWYLLAVSLVSSVGKMANNMKK